MLGLWWLTPRSTIFQLYRGGQCVRFIDVYKNNIHLYSRRVFDKLTYIYKETDVKKKIDLSIIDYRVGITNYLIFEITVTMTIFICCLTKLYIALETILNFGDSYLVVA